MKTFSIYPPCRKPQWVKIGATCHCNGDRNVIFKIDDISAGKRAAFLVDLKGYLHGWESFKKLSHFPL